MAIKTNTPAPDFTLPSHLGKPVTLSQLKGKNVVLAFFPLTFTPVCSSQIPAYEAELAKFTVLDTQILALSVDNTASQKAWAESLGGIHYPILSDFWPHGQVALQYGILRDEGYTERTVIVIDKQGIVRYVDVHDFNSPPSNLELRRILREIDPEVRDRPEELPDSDKPLPHGGVVMYCTPWCPDCKRARTLLAQHHIPFTEVDISTNPRGAAQVELWAGGFRTTPTFDIDGTVIVDYDERRLREVLRF
jgi:peroxiredoxin/glutaredoxin